MLRRIICSRLWVALFTWTICPWCRDVLRRPLLPTRRSNRNTFAGRCRRCGADHRRDLLRLNPRLIIPTTKNP